MILPLTASIPYVRIHEYFLQCTVLLILLVSGVLLTLTLVKWRIPCRDDFKEAFDREKRFVCSRMVGGIGNYMFAFASAYGIASAVNKTVVIQKDNMLNKYFRVKAKIVNDFCICDNAKHVSEDKDCSFKKDLLMLNEHRNYRPSFYLQSWKYFDHVADDIRQQFTFKKDLSAKALNLIQAKVQAMLKGKADSVGNVTSQPAVTIGVHVRRGDITRNSRFVKYGYMAAPPQYFQKAMDYFRKKFLQTVFLVCSDDMKWSKKNIDGSDVIYMEGNSFDVDLAILSHCNHSIISVGTFGWWSAFLAAGETIYYKHPARKGSGLRNQFSEDFSDYFYQGWVGMD